MQLLFVLIDFFEVLVGVHLQLAAGGLVAGDDSVGMELQGADGPGVIHAALYAVAQGAGLVGAADQQQHLLGIAHGAHTDGQGGVDHAWTISALQLHPDGIIACDEAACGELKVDTYKYFKEIYKNE